MQDEITIAAVGDLMLGGRVEPFLKEFGPDYPFTDVMPFLSRADVVVGNLESSISTRGTAVENKKFTLRAGPIAATGAQESRHPRGVAREQSFDGLRPAGAQRHPRGP